VELEDQQYAGAGEHGAPHGDRHVELLDDGEGAAAVPLAGAQEVSAAEHHEVGGEDEPQRAGMHRSRRISR
jgi:hypothetical protein